MGRSLESKKEIVKELKALLSDSEMALVLDYKGLSIKDISDLRTRLHSKSGICKVTKNTLMRKAIDGNSNWSQLNSLLTGANAFVLVKGDIGAIKYNNLWHLTLMQDNETFISFYNHFCEEMLIYIRNFKI